MPLNTLPSLISGRSLRTQIAWVFGALVVTLAVLLSLGFGEALKRRIQGDANASLQMVTDNTAAFLAHGLFERIREVQVLADWFDQRLGAVPAGTVVFQALFQGVGSVVISGTSWLWMTVPVSSRTTTERASSPASGPSVIVTP